MYYNKPRVYSNYNNVERVTDKEFGDKLNFLVNCPNVSWQSEKDFINSLKAYWDKHGGLTVKQSEAVNRLEEKYKNYNSPNEWKASFTDEMKEKFNIIVDYYLTTIYYRDVCVKAKTDPAFIPSEKQYKAMCENKYSISLLENYYTEPKFEAGDRVILRDNVNTIRNYSLRDVEDKVIMIVEPTDSVSPAKGSRKYRVLAFGASETTEVEERNMKLFRKR